MQPLDEEGLAGEALKNSLIGELASAVDARLETLNLSQAVVWLSGYVVGRVAASRKGLSIEAHEHPLQISFLDTLDPIVEDTILTRENGG